MIVVGAVFFAVADFGEAVNGLTKKSNRGAESGKIFGALLVLVGLLMALFHNRLDALVFGP